MTKAMNVACGVGLVALIVILTGCANPVATHYVASGDSGEFEPGAAVSVEIRETANLTYEEARLRRQGWREIGRAAFAETGTLNRAQLVAQARAVGADLVLWHGWSMEEKLEGASVEASDTDPAIEVPTRPGESPSAPRLAIRRSTDPHKVTITRFTISFWRKVGRTLHVAEHE